MKRSLSYVSTLLLAVLPLGCASHHHGKPGPGSAVITGTVTYPGVLPPDASLTVYLVENTSTTQAVEVLANDVVSFSHGSPVPFSIVYSLADIVEENRYSLGARATAVDGQVILRSNAYLVLTKGGPKDQVNIQMTPAWGTK